MIAKMWSITKQSVLFCVKWRYIVALLLFIFCVAFKVHGSSIGEYNKLFDNYQSYTEESKVLGTSRPIRSDEYIVHTPYYMSQIYNGFEKSSHMMSLEGQDMIVGYNAPVADITLIAKPFTWGYVLFGNEYGLSWYWCSKLILLVLVSFELCLIITRKNLKVSLLGALLIAYAPLVQWWFVPHMVDVFFWVMAVLVLAYHFFVSSGWKNILFMCLLPLSCITFVLALFPSLQLPLGLVAIVLLIAFLIRDKKDITFKKADWWKILVMAAAIIIIIGYTLLTSKDAILALYSTVYPGERMSLGGGSGIGSLFTNLVTFALPYKDITYSNNCEISNFIHFAPIFLLIYPMIYKKMKKNKQMIVGNVLVVCIIVMAVFMMIGFPKTLAIITGFRYVNRMDIAYGLVATWFTVWGIDMVWRKKILSLKQIVTVVLIYIACYLVLLSQKQLSYMGLKYYLSMIVVLAFIVFLVLRQKKYISLICISILVMVSSFKINPIVTGASALFDHPLEKEIHRLAEESPTAYWFANGDNRLASIGVANGARMLNMVNFYPDFEKWHLLDETGDYDDIYNRYAHICVELTDTKTEFLPGATADLFRVKINYKDLSKWPVDYIVSSGEIKYKIPYEKIYEDTEGDYYIYHKTEK